MPEVARAIGLHVPRRPYRSQKRPTQDVASDLERQLKHAPEQATGKGKRVCRDPRLLQAAEVSGGEAAQQLPDHIIASPATSNCGAPGNQQPTSQVVLRQQNKGQEEQQPLSSTADLATTAVIDIMRKKDSQLEHSRLKIADLEGQLKAAVAASRMSHTQLQHVNGRVALLESQLAAVMAANGCADARIADLQRELDIYKEAAAVAEAAAASAAERMTPEDAAAGGGVGASGEERLMSSLMDVCLAVQDNPHMKKKLLAMLSK